MVQTEYGELVFDQGDLVDLIMQGQDLATLSGMLVDDSVKLDPWPEFMPQPGLVHYHRPDCGVAEWHSQQQQQWHMPQAYKDLDIAQLVLSLCDSEAELQRCGQELLMYQERDLFDLLRYLKYLVDVMQDNHIIWGVGRGSSVASYVLYKLGVHRIDSLYYNLDITEFLR
jgi:DNA polymerase III alpha subunit